MATTKKTTTKKPVAKKAPVTKKASVAKKAPTRPSAPRSKKVSTKATQSTASVRSFHKAKEELPFTTFRVTRQTLYWVILVSFIIFAQLWIINLQVEVATLLDAQQAQLQEL